VAGRERRIAATRSLKKTQAKSMSKKQIEACVRETLEQYFKDLHGVEPNSMHEMFLSTVEKPLLDVVLRHADGNQSKAAEWLGINRNTLRRKLLEHKLVDQ
jgi:Fis family transcriptional regulator